MKRRLSFLAVVWLLSSLASAAPAAERQKSVLLIYELRRDMLSNVVVDRAIRKILDEEFTVNLDIRSEYFEDSSSPEQVFPVLASWLRRKYSGITFDVVVPIGQVPLRFVRDYGQEVLHDAQIVYWGRKAALDEWESRPPITGVVAPDMESQIRGTFAYIRTLQPDLKQLVVVSGVSPLDRTWESAARRELRPFEDRIRITYLAGQSLEEVQKSLASLPRRAAIFFLGLSEDAAGRRLLRTQYLSKAVQEAAAPAYSTSAVYLDTGIVGGALLDQETMAVEAAGLVARVLRGEDIRRMPVRETSLVPMVNWKALNRWRLSPDRLPRGTVVMYKDPSVWDSYKWHIFAVVSLCVLEGGLIVALLVHRSHRKRAEKSMLESRQLLQSAIDALNARVALLDERGTIIAVNRPWKSYGESKGNGSASDSVGENYLEACSANMECEEASLVSEGIRRLMLGELEDFRCIYPSTRADGTFWFQVRVNRFDMDGLLRLVITYEDVTEIKQAHDAQQQLTRLLMDAQDEERRRIARDLHDVTVQNAAAIKAGLISVGRKLPALAPDTAEMLNESVSLCDQVIKELRTLSYVLHPPFLDEAGLVPALRWLVRGFMERSGVQVQLVTEDIGRLPASVETALFRVVQESLTNIHRHSGSSSAVISVAKENDTVVLQVRDEGHGFLLPTTPDNSHGAISPGVGILSMRQRLKQLGGRLEIESSAQGTNVSARVSISKDDQNVAYLTG
jgi:two-component system, NarL family, sensor kinase